MKEQKLSLTNEKRFSQRMQLIGEPFPVSACQLLPLYPRLLTERKVALLDANVFRVLCRRYCLEITNSRVKEKEQLMQLATNLLPKKKSEMAQYSQYIMDLGAIVCKSTQPACNKCPVSEDCESFNSETVNLYPKKVKLTRREKQITWVLTMDRDLILLERQNKDELWKSLFVPASEVKMRGNLRLPRKIF